VTFLNTYKSYISIATHDVNCSMITTKLSRLLSFRNLKKKWSFEMKNNNNPIRESGCLLLRTIRKVMKELSHLKGLSQVR
jgi:hypothetical protein